MTQLTAGEMVTLLQRSPNQIWLKIKTSEGEEGWVDGDYITVSPVVLASVETATFCESAPSDGEEIVLGGDSISRKLAPGEEKWYFFETKNNEMFFVLLYEPRTVNTDQVKISFHKEQSSNPIGFGDTIPGREGLILKSETLNAGERLFLRVLNNSAIPIDYCLASKDVPNWTC